MSHEHVHHDYAEANVKHFNEQARSYRTELALELAKRCATSIRQHYAFDPERTVVLDFACGPGLVAFELAPHVKRLVGADAALGMVEVFNQTVQEHGWSKEKCEAVHIDRLKGDGTDLDGELFDVIICVQSYHHFEDPQHITQLLAQRLRQGGRLMVVDFLDDEGVAALFGHEHAHTHAHIVAHKHGFSMEQMTKMFQSSGLQNVHVESAFKISKNEMKSYQGHEIFGHAMHHGGDFTLQYFIACGDK